MWRKTPIALLALALLLCGAGRTRAVPEETLVTLRGGPDAGITLSVQNAVFNVISFSFRYDTAQVKPAGGFDDTVQCTQQAPWLTFIDKRLDEEHGLLSITAYVSPGHNGETGFDNDGHAVTGEAALPLLTLHFTRIADTGNPILTLAVKDDGGVYSELNPEGAALLRSGVAVPFSLSFEWERGGEPEPPYYSIPGNRPAKPALTRAERMKGTILLPIGGNHCLAEGARMPIYEGEPDVTAYAKSNRTYVPVRFVSERLGAEVLWDNDTQTVTVLKGGRTVVMQVGSDRYFIDGVAQEMDAPAEFSGREGDTYRRTMVPVRFVAEALEIDVQWDRDNQMVILSPKDNPWDATRTVEQDFMRDALLLLSPLVEPFLP